MPRSRVRVFLLTALLAAAAAALAMACLPGYTFAPTEVTDAGNDGPASTDARADGPTATDGGSAEATMDALAEASPPSPDASVPVTVANVGSMSSSTGYGYQTHLVFAQNDGRYWYFYVDDTATAIKTLSSPDLSTWTAGAEVPLGGGYSLADGYGFSVAYANLAGNDVVHIVANGSMSSSYSTLHLRATIVGGVLSASAASVLPDSTSGGGCPNDGPATAITPGGQVFDVTAWAAHSDTSCDTNVYLSPGVDTGTTWSSSAFTHDGYYVSVPDLAFSHDLLALPEAGTVMVLYPDEDNDTTDEYFGVGWALSPSFDGGAPGTTGFVEDASVELFTSAKQQSSFDDWSVCRLGASEVHVVRHVLSSIDVSSFEEVVYLAGRWQTTTAPPPASTSPTDTGVVLLGDANPSDGMLLVTLGIDGSLHVARWTSAAGWAAAGTIAGDGNVRQSLAGSGCGGARPTVFWTETIGAANVIESLDVSGYL